MAGSLSLSALSPFLSVCQYNKPTEKAMLAHKLMLLLLWLCEALIPKSNHINTLCVRIFVVLQHIDSKWICYWAESAGWGMGGGTNGQTVATLNAIVAEEIAKPIWYISLSIFLTLSFICGCNSISFSLHFLDLIRTHARASERATKDSGEMLCNTYTMCFL